MGQYSVFRARDLSWPIRGHYCLVFLQVSTDEASIGVLITGGNSALNTAELYVPSRGASCNLPSLPDLRVAHTVTKGGLICGGLNTPNSCLQWSPDTGTWEEALTLDVPRRGHVSWTPSSGNTGTYLMGGVGRDIWKTTTLITNNGSQDQGFPLKYATK